MSLILSTKNYLAFTDSTIHTAIAPEPEGVTFTYASDGDANGLFYYLGTSKGTAAWTNPITASKFTMVLKNLVAGSADLLVDRATSQFYLSSVLGNYIGIDLGAGQRIRVTDYLLRNRVESIESLINWKLQGSNNVSSLDVAGFDAATWEDIDERVNDTSFTGVNAYGHFISNKSNTKLYRFVRLITTGATTNGGFFLCLGEIELYGKFVD